VGPDHSPPRYRDAVRPPIKPSVLWTLAPLGAPLPRRLTGVAVYSRPHRCRLTFFLDVVAAISDEGPGMAIGGQQPGHLHNSRARGPRFRPWPHQPDLLYHPCAPAAALRRLARVSAALRSTRPRTTTRANEPQLLCKSGQFIAKAFAVFKVLTLLIQVGGQYHLGFRGSFRYPCKTGSDTLILAMSDRATDREPEKRAFRLRLCSTAPQTSGPFFCPWNRFSPRRVGG
jgi:hypothetical protein